MPKDKTMTKQQAIDELRKEAQELEEKSAAFSDYAGNAYKARIRRNVANKLEKELNNHVSDKTSK